MTISAGSALKNPGRIPELDGIRGFAIFMVIAWHYVVIPVSSITDYPLLSLVTKPFQTLRTALYSFGYTWFACMYTCFFMPKLQSAFEPAKFDVVLYFDFHNSDFNWFDLIRRG